MLPPDHDTAPPLDTVAPSSAFPSASRFGYRSLDRQWVIHDSRVLDRPGPPLWGAIGDRQVFMTSLLTGLLGEGLGATATADIPDLHHFRGSFGAKDVIPLWRDSSASEPNLTAGLLDALAVELGEATPETLFAYVYAVLAGDYTERFAAELEVPGPRIPIAKDADLFEKTADLGRRLIWLHTYGERFVPDGQKPGPIPEGSARCTVSVPSSPDDYPEEFDYNRDTKHLTVGKGVFEPVEPEVWDFNVSGLQVVKSWLSYRMKEGAGKRSSPLDKIRPEQWPASFTEELCRLLWIVEQTLALVPKARDCLADIVDGPVFEADELPTPTDDERAAPKVAKDNPEQLAIETE